jgi:uncharacterized membrane protein YozB (DUF420 family)
MNTLAAQRRNTSWWLIPLLLVTAVLVLRFVPRNALPYFSMSDAELQRAAPTTTLRWALFSHLSSGMVAIFLGLVQLWLGERRQYMHWHRNLGKLYGSADLLGSIGAFYMALTINGGVAYKSGLFFLGVAWLTTTSMAYVSIRHRIFEQHREWMIRSYVVTLAFVCFRLLGQILTAVGVPPTADRAGAQAWVCWALPLLIAEVFLQLRKTRRPATV